MLVQILTLLYHLKKAMNKQEDVKQTKIIKYQSLSVSQFAHLIRPALNSGFHSMKWLGILPLLSGWDASPSQGYTQHYDHQYPFIYLGEVRSCEVIKSFLSSKETMRWQRPRQCTNHKTTMPSQKKNIRG